MFSLVDFILIVGLCFSKHPTASSFSYPVVNDYLVPWSGYSPGDAIPESPDSYAEFAPSYRSFPTYGPPYSPVSSREDIPPFVNPYLLEYPASEDDVYATSYRSSIVHHDLLRTSPFNDPFDVPDADSGNRPFMSNVDPPTYPCNPSYPNQRDSHPYAPSFIDYPVTSTYESQRRFNNAPPLFSGTPNIIRGKAEPAYKSIQGYHYAPTFKSYQISSYHELQRPSFIPSPSPTVLRSKYPVAMAVPPTLRTLPSTTSTDAFSHSTPSSPVNPVPSVVTPTTSPHDGPTTNILETPVLHPSQTFAGGHLRFPSDVAHIPDIVYEAPGRTYPKRR